jgi:hypothetical protein
MNKRWLFVLLALALLPRTAPGESCSASPFVCAEIRAVDAGGTGDNILRLFDNTAPTPGCAKCVDDDTDAFCWTDGNAADGTLTPQLCVKTDLVFQPPATSTTTTEFMSATTTAGVYENETITLGTDTDGNYAVSSSEGGAATTATALAANGANCTAGNYALGVDASGAVETCTSLFDRSGKTSFYTDFFGYALPSDLRGVAGGTGSTGTFRDLSGGVFRAYIGTVYLNNYGLTLGAGDGSAGRFGTAKNAVFETRLQTSTVDTGFTGFWGVWDAGTAWTGTERAVFSVVKGVNSDLLQCTTETGGVETVTSDTTNPASAFAVYQIVLNATTNVVFKVNGATVCTHTTNLPSNTAALEAGFYVIQAANPGVTGYLDLDYLQMYQDR